MKGLTMEGLSSTTVRRARVGWLVTFRFEPSGSGPKPTGPCPGLEHHSPAIPVGVSWRPTSVMAENRGRRWMRRQIRRTERYDNEYTVTR